jgi:hypothetical protein
MNHRSRLNTAQAAKLKHYGAIDANTGGRNELLSGKAAATGLTATKHSGPRREEGRTEVASRTSESAVTCEGALVPDKGGSGVVGGGAGISWEALI